MNNEGTSNPCQPFLFFVFCSILICAIQKLNFNKNLNILSNIQLIAKITLQTCDNIQYKENSDDLKTTITKKLSIATDKPLNDNNSFSRYIEQICENNLNIIAVWPYDKSSDKK